MVFTLQPKLIERLATAPGRVAHFSSKWPPGLLNAWRLPAIYRHQKSLPRKDARASAP